MSSPTPAPIGRELLDDPQAEPTEVRTSLRHIARANRWLGGRAAVRYGVARLLAGVPPERAISLLDIGTGEGDLPAALTRWAARRGRRLRCLGLERHPLAARLASQSGLPTVLGCAGDLPFAPGSIDVVLLSQVVHHLAAPSRAELYRAASRLARLGVVVSDLYRSPWAVAGWRAASRLLAMDPITRHDGAVSIRRGFSVGELRAELAAQGLAPRVSRRPGFRLVAVWSTA